MERLKTEATIILRLFDRTPGMVGYLLVFALDFIYAFQGVQIHLRLI